MSNFLCTRGEPDDRALYGRQPKGKAKDKGTARPRTATPDPRNRKPSHKQSAQPQKGAGPEQRPANADRGRGEDVPDGSRPARQPRVDDTAGRPPSMDRREEADQPHRRRLEKDGQMHKSRKDQTDNSVQILLIGKTGNGKSSVGNRILGLSPPPFEVCTGILSATTQTQLGQNFREYNGEKIKVQVIDFPDVVEDDLQEDDRQRETEICLDLTFPFPTAVCLVVRADVRFTPEEYTSYQKTRRLLNDRLKNNLIVVFTMADKLPPDQREHFEDQLKVTNEQLRNVIRDAHDRYVVLGSRDAQDKTENQTTGADEAVSKLLGHVTELRNRQRKEYKSLSAMIVGPPGSGKSATANLLLNYCETPIFKEDVGMATKPGKSAGAIIRGFKLEVADTPGNLLVEDKTDHHNEELLAWLRDSEPHVIIYVINVSHRFTAENLKILRFIGEAVGGEEDLKRRLIIVFTGLDKLKKRGKKIKSELERGPECLRKLVESAGNRYYSLDNKNRTDHQAQTLQKNNLLQLMVRVAQDWNWRTVDLSYLSIPPARGVALSSNKPDRPGNNARTDDTPSRPMAEQPGDTQDQNNASSKCTIS